MALKGKYQQTNGWVKCIQWLGCTFLLSIPAMGSIVLFPQPLTIISLKWIQLIQTSSLLLLPPLIMAYLWSPEPIRWLCLENKNGNEEKGIGKWLLAIGIMIAALPAINMLSYWNQQMDLPAFLAPMEAWMKTKEETAKILTEQFMSVNTVGGLVANLLLMAALPALAEELTFRGVLQRLFQARDERREDKGQRIPHMAIWCTAILFSAIHLQFYGFVPRMLMGALFGYALAWSGTLWLPILMHLTNNAMAVLISYVSIKAGWDMETVDSIGTNDTLWLGIVSLLITCIGIYAFRRSTTISKASSRMSSGS